MKKSFARDADFNLQDFANRAFGVFQNEDEYGEVIWRFSPQAAAPRAASSSIPDRWSNISRRSLIVRFSAAGHLEMCWHLYLWGDQVEVLAPEGLRRRSKATAGQTFRRCRKAGC